MDALKHKKRIFLLCILLLTLPLLYALTFTIINQTDFNLGVYNRSFFNTNNNALELNNSFFSGNYTSQIFDATTTATWSLISWTPDRCYQCEMVDNQTLETSYINVTNMTGNVLLMHFNNNTAQGENSTFFLDASRSGNNGTCAAQSCPRYNTTGRFNQAYTFDGKDDNVTLGDALESTINGNHTITAWIYPTDDVTESIINKYNPTTGNRQWGFSYRGDFIMTRYGALNGATYRQYITGNSTYPTHKWYHVVLVADPVNDNYRIYLNGTEVKGAKAGTGNITLVPNSAEPTRIGSGGGTNDYYFNGTIDELAIWNRTLSEQEIADLYARGALYLNHSVRSCDDAACSGESYTSLVNSPGQINESLSLSTNRYFQFFTSFASENISLAPKVYNLTITYTETYVPPVPEWSTIGMILIITITLVGYYYFSKQ